jgi:DNA-binding response OmpR family regulator
MAVLTRHCAQPAGRLTPFGHLATRPARHPARPFPGQGTGTASHWPPPGTDRGGRWIRIGDFLVDLAARKIISAHMGDSLGPVRLTPTEWRLLDALTRRPGRFVSRQQLLAEVWGPGYERATGNLRLFVAQLRRKLEPDPARPRWLITVPGMGYRFDCAPRLP